MQLKKITTDDDFWYIYDQMFDDKSRFMFMRDTIMQNMKRGNMSGLTDADGSLLPCFCVAKNQEVIIMWVHSNYRRRGIGSTFVKLLNVNRCYEPLDEAKSFWKFCGIPSCK
jgi:GNAT superfamily N-acetyltransferase